MEKLIYLLMVLGTFLAGAEEGKSSSPPEPIGYLKETWYAARPISINQASALTFHYYNLSQAPLRLGNFDRYLYTPRNLRVNVPSKDFDAKKEYDRWGPPTLNGISFSNIGSEMEVDKLRLSGYSPEMLSREYSYPKRDDLVLFGGEGYARKFTFLPGWVSKEETKQIPLGTKCLVLAAVAIQPVSTPQLKPEACQPGKPILWSEPKRVYGLGPTLIPFQANLPPPPKAVEAVPEAASGLILELEPPLKLVDGAAFELTWIVGNGGKEPVFVEQNSCCPGVASWSLSQSGKEIYNNDGADMKMIMDLYPAREPFLLMPGECLSFRRTFYPAELGWKPGQEHELKLELKSRWKKLDGAQERKTSGQVLTDVREASWHAQTGKDLLEAHLSASAKIKPIKAGKSNP